MAKKYRYFMSGMFCPTDAEEYEINIPLPFLHNSKAEAMKDEAFGYRFLLLDDVKGPEIIIYEKENFKVVEDGDRKYLEQWVDGNVIGSYTFEEFKKTKGYIRMLKPELKGCGYIDGNTDFLDTDKSFKDVFPNMQKQKMYYIDSEAYYIEEVDAMTVKDLIVNKDYDYISWRVTLPGQMGGGDTFFGCTKSENGKLIPFDGDIYSEDTEILSYEEWTNEAKGIKNGLTVVCEGRWSPVYDSSLKK